MNSEMASIITKIKEYQLTSVMAFSRFCRVSSIILWVSFMNNNCALRSSKITAKKLTSKVDIILFTSSHISLHCCHANAIISLAHL